MGGEALSLDELAQFGVFDGTKRAFWMKLARNLGTTTGEAGLGIRSVVRRDYRKGEVICRAGEFGASAFVLVEGSARSFVPGRSTAAAVPGRTESSLRALAELFRRRSRTRVDEPDPAALGEVTRYAGLPSRRPRERMIEPGELFGIDTCVNFYPREATVEATSDCVVLEVLRCVVDTIRDAGTQGPRIEEEYRARAIRSALDLVPVFSDLSMPALDALADHAELLTPESDTVKDGLLYEAGAPADAIFVIRAGTVCFRGTGAGRVLGYLGRGALFGLEAILPPLPDGPLRLESTSHPRDFEAVEIGEGITLGRSSACDIAFPPEARVIGRRHCRLEVRDDALFVVHLGSVNPTRVNGQSVQEARVEVGALIRLEDYEFRVCRGVVPARDPAVSPPRLASASGLDDFEVVRLPSAVVRAALPRSPAVERVVASIARSIAAVDAARVPPDPATLGPLVELGLHNAQNTLLIDLDRCTRCDECVRACADAHDGVSRFTRDGPRFGRQLVTMACRSCTDPKCMVGCPVGSIRRLESLEVHIEDWCVGCERCANQCPYGNIDMIELAADASAADEPGSPRLRAAVCDLCAGHEGPRCVYACPHDAAIRVNPQEFLTSTDLR